MIVCGGWVGCDCVVWWEGRDMIVCGGWVGCECVVWWEGGYDCVWWVGGV